VFKIRNDPRISPFGKILRRTSIDELPQLWNVLRGEMSLVGPRPITLGEKSGVDPKWIKSRLSILPGMTGLWQVSGRNNLSFEKWIELDSQYMKKWSLWLDFKILLKSIFKITSSEGA
jgi:lipopolysaccharide/colanic/teichoic acid biosynthesis glycosyltransferase